MNTFYIARHGETENNRAKRLSGWIDTPLTENGLVPTQRAIAKLSGLLKIDVVYSSDLGRAFITAYEMAFGIGLETERIIRLPGLREVNYGDAANMISQEAYKLYPGIDSDTHFMPPNGETLDRMQERVINTVVELDAAHTDAVILLVAHSGTMAALDADYRGTDFGQHNISEAYAHDYVGRFTMENGHVLLFEEVR